MNVFKSIGIIAIIAIVSKMLGFFRETLIGYYFGVSSTTDAYFIALNIPNLLFAAFATAISSGIIPIYINKKNEDKKNANDFVQTLSSLFFFISIIITIIAFFFSRDIVHFIAGNISKQEMDLADYLTKITLPSFCFFVLSAYANGILNANKHFIVPSISTLPYNFIIILFMILFENKYGVVGVTYCALLAAVTQYIIQYPSMKKYDLGFTLKITNFNQETRKVLLSFIPITIASVAVQLNGLVDQMVASRLSSGTVSAINYSTRVLYLPLSIVTTSLITVFYPMIMDALNTSKEKFFSFSFKGMKLILSISIPIAVVMFTMSHEIIQIIFERGAFNEKATKLTSYSFFFFTPALFSIGLRDYFIRCFMAVDRNRITMISSITAVPLNMILCVTLSHYIANGGIALATSIATSLQSIFLFIVLLKDYRSKEEKLSGIFIDLGKLAGLFVLLDASILVMKHVVIIHNVYLSFSFNTIVCFVLFIIFSVLFKEKEFLSFVSMIKKKGRR